MSTPPLQQLAISIFNTAYERVTTLCRQYPVDCGTQVPPNPDGSSSAPELEAVTLRDLQARLYDIWVAAQCGIAEDKEWQTELNHPKTNVTGSIKTISDAAQQVSMDNDSIAASVVRLSGVLASRVKAPRVEWYVLLHLAV
jgi:hypothetical protein